LTVTTIGFGLLLFFVGQLPDGKVAPLDDSLLWINLYLLQLDFTFLLIVPWRLSLSGCFMVWENTWYLDQWMLWWSCLASWSSDAHLWIIKSSSSTYLLPIRWLLLHL